MAKPKRSTSAPQVCSGPNKAEMRKYDAEHRVVQAFRETPEFRKAARAMEKAIAQDEKKAIQIVRSTVKGKK